MEIRDHVTKLVRAASVCSLITSPHSLSHVTKSFTLLLETKLIIPVISAHLCKCMPTHHSCLSFFSVPEGNFCHTFQIPLLSSNTIPHTYFFTSPLIFALSIWHILLPS